MKVRESAEAVVYSQGVAHTELQIQESVPLAGYTTFRVGGSARCFAEVRSEDELLGAVEFASREGIGTFVLGGGSNLLVSDSGFDGLVIHIALNAPTEVKDDASFVEYTVAAGLDWNSFVHQICEQGISGIECLAGIPGSVGGTPVQNVGAYGQEVASTITRVRVLDLETREFVWLSREQCGFSYRHSIFNSTHRGRYIVTAVSFLFDRSARPNLSYADLQRHFGASATPTPLEVYHAVREIRHGKGMLIVDGEADCRSAGSFFKNPVVPESVLAGIASSVGVPIEKVPHWPAGVGKVKLAAAWLLEHAGFVKGFSMGEAGISSRHTLALINRGHATAADVEALRDAIRAEVRRRFGVELEQEPVNVS
ncbi:UDP-N-acetylenolpyruvoylglucosamine reductase [Edaphobacter acidisoli]|uniref:UDP-N-acetylenolpyruvoylglucosamine reductase n=1 Tax=Edaphobacter acidisoli TaxID=2040573 RepID=A0A916RKK3_9BACT|nr:UDP-N-acetylmuramate dehydrogenase [Edaphobacter acidisoli]GGA57290.1 UDP-N-acetylenolpyruvoylglucosamine reductase [Edaphobacter acidisoli]